MKKWLSVVTAAFASGMILVLFAHWKFTSTARDILVATEEMAARSADEIIAWEQTRARLIEEAARLPRLTSPESAKQLLDLDHRAKTTLSERPAGAQPGRLPILIDELATQKELVALIDWERAAMWNASANKVVSDIQTAVTDERNWDDEKLAVFKSAMSVIEELKASKPPGADAELLLHAMKEVNDAMSTLRRQIENRKR